ncbi:RNA recognition motif domain-containing protein [Ditylenchus destructor]|uniref:RNA recognition motif domain-containing protein n=1 Tax=Ditylenchus destructor TaxID=166010 RepID=A0AAD4MIN1_9BILA|nr:RNA recognition motif domain-containing protein [Ditylenchus destructor]
MPTMARSDHTARLLQSLGYLTISRRNLHKLIVSGLPEETTYPYLSLLEYYTRFGEVRGYRVLDDSSSRVAFIYYDKIQAINRSLNSGKHVVDGKTLYIHDKMECQDDELDEADYRLATIDPSKIVLKAQIVQQNDSGKSQKKKGTTEVEQEDSGKSQKKKGTTEVEQEDPKPEVSTDQIQKFYQQFGHVLSCSIDYIHLRPLRRSCLVKFSTKDEMEHALDNRPNTIDNVKLNDHHVRCPARSYVVENLSSQTTDESLYKLLRPEGPLFECTVVRDSTTGESLCHAYVTFVNREHRNSSIKRLAIVDGVIPTIKTYRFPKRIRSSLAKLNNGSKISSTPQEPDDFKPIIGRFWSWIKWMIDGREVCTESFKYESSIHDNVTSVINYFSLL